MGRMENERLLPSAEASLGHTRADARVPLAGALTWAATVDPNDDTREIEITDEMVRLAIAEIEHEQIYPFVSGAAPLARPVRKADVIVFPGSVGREDAPGDGAREGAGRDGVS